MLGKEHRLLVLPLALDRMTVLKVLRLYLNNFESLVPGIEKLRSCHSMNLSSNRLSTLPAFPAAHSLTSLDLSNNKFVEFPDSISEISALLVLNLSQNLLLEIPSCTALLTQLTLLDISRNSIDTLHPRFWLMTSLEVLKLNHNSMGSIRPLEADSIYATKKNQVKILTDTTPIKQ